MMGGLVTWMGERFAPQLHRATNNAWVGGIQDSMLRIVPFVLVGSIVTLATIIPGVTDAVPAIWELNNYSFGLIGLFVSFLIPYFVLERRKRQSVSVVGGLTGLAVYLMLLKPIAVDQGVAFDVSRFGAGGMFAAILGGLFVALVMDLFARLEWFKDSAMPSFVINWFNSLLPILLSTATVWLLTFVLDFDMFAGIVELFSPLTTASQSFVGFVLINFVQVFLYSFGISPWALSALTYPIWYAAIQANAEALAAGGQASNINTNEVIFSGFIAFGGIGATLTLTLMMAFLAQSQRLKAIGRACLVPSIFNINEPVVFGAPIAFNPVLMIPMWINGAVPAAITYVALSWDFAKIPDAVFALWYIPFPIQTAFVSDWRGVILASGLIALTALIWYPFFRTQDALDVEEEAAELKAATTGATANVAGAA